MLAHKNLYFIMHMILYALRKCNFVHETTKVSVKQLCCGLPFTDSAPFWQGILDIGLLETTIHEMKVQLSTIKRRILSTSDVTIAG